MLTFINSTLSRYLMRLYFLNFMGLIFILLGVVFLFDTIELLRRAGKVEDVPASLIIGMGLLKLPEMALIISPFGVLFSALYTFWQLTKRHELVILRAAGISVWQFLMPIIVVGLTSGIVMVTVINPVSAVFYSQYSTLERAHLKREDTSIIAVFDQGLWLRQEQADKGYAILHAETIDPDWRLRDVMVLSFSPKNIFRERYDAPSATLKAGHWLLRDVTLNSPGKSASKSDVITIPTSLTPQDIEESFSSPKSMGFWMMPSFVNTLESTGFDSTRVRIHFQSLLAQPFLYVAMILLAACVALRPQRQGQSFMFVTIGVLTGFVVFLMSNFLQALGASHQLPVFLSAWSPAFIALLFGTSVLLTLEDG